MKTRFILILAMIAVLISVTQIRAVSAETGATNSILAISLVNTDPDPTIAGDTAEVRLGVQNAGGQNADDMVIEFVPSYPFSLAPGENAVNPIGTMQGYQGFYNNDSLKIVKYNILVNKDAPAGTYNLKFKSYQSGSASSAETTLPIEVNSRASAEVIQIDKTVLVPGKQTSMRFKITNVGNAPLRDLTFSWSNSDKTILPVGSDNTKYIKYIDVGESADLEYQVIANSNAVAGLYSLDLKLSYYDQIIKGDKTIETIAGIYVGGGTDFDIAFSQNTGGQMSFTIANIGSNPASSVSVIIPQQPGWSVSGANSMIIGNLNTGDYTVASFTLQSAQASLQAGSQGNVTPDAQRNINQSGFPGARAGAQSGRNLKVQIDYTDTMGTRESVEKNISMGTQLSASGNSTALAAYGAGSFRGAPQQKSFFVEYKTYIIVVLVLAALVAGGFINRKYRKEKLTDPDFKLKNIFRKKETVTKRR